jgi:uncharacterized protein (TIGR03067 family)
MCRRVMLGLVALLAVVAPGVADDKPKEEAAKEEVKKLQGTWQVTKWIHHSEEPAAADEIKHFTFEFKDRTVTLRKSKGDEGKEMKYTLDPSKKPRSFDLPEGGADGDVAEGIYKIDGDELTICIIGGIRNDKAAPRPTEFKASKREKYTLFVMKKVKK